MQRYDPFGEGAEFHHLGLSARSIEDALGEGADSVHDPIQRVRIAFVSLSGVCVELVEPAADDSPVTAAIRSGRQLLHVCFTVPDLQIATSQARSHGFHQVAKPAPAAAFEGRHISWVYSPVYGLVELLAAGENP